VKFSRRNRIFPGPSSGIRKITDSSVVAVKEDGVLSINSDPQMTIKQNAELILIGTDEGERKFLKAFESF
jgi:K+/H+ antiporter YhaU regulatory subunit KhtT